MPRLIPRDERFHELFADFSKCLLESAQKLKDLLDNYDQREERIDEIQRIEHKADIIDREIGDRLERSFVTPFDREDIHALSSRLDDVVDEIQEVAEAFEINDIETPTAEARELVRILAAAASELDEAIGGLQKLKGLEPHLEAIHELEHEADGVSRAAIAALYKGKDAMFALKWREIYAGLEEAIDAIEDCGEVLERIVTKA